MAILHFERDMRKLKEKLVMLFELVNKGFENSISALFDNDIEKARNVIQTDQTIDELEVDIEDDGLKILALQQPVGRDLRHVYAILKVNHELERVGDKSVHIAERAIEMADIKSPCLVEELRIMAHKASMMLKMSVDCVINLDEGLGMDVWKADREVNELKRAIIKKINEKIDGKLIKDPLQMEALINIYSLSFLIERIADNTKNVAKQVIYTVTGEIIRHRAREKILP